MKCKALSNTKSSWQNLGYLSQVGTMKKKTFLLKNNGRWGSGGNKDLIALTEVWRAEESDLLSYTLQGESGEENETQAPIRRKKEKVRNNSSKKRLLLGYHYYTFLLQQWDHYLGQHLDTVTIVCCYIQSFALLFVSAL